MLHHCNNSLFPGAKNLPENQAIFEYYDLMLQSISSYSFQALAHLDFPRRYFDSWEIPEKTIMWEVIIHFSFLISAIAMAYTDKILYSTSHKNH